MKAQAHRFTERASCQPMREAMMTDDGNTIQNVCLIGEISANGRRFSEQAMQDIAGMSQGSPVYMNHITPREAAEHKGNRDIRLLAGTLTEGRVQRGDDGKLRVYADLKLAPTSRDTFRFIAETKPREVGMSIDAMGKSQTSGKMEEVVSVTKLYSVDLVANPATTGSLSEATDDGKGKQENTDMELKEIVESQATEIADLKAKVSEAVEAAKAKDAKIAEQDKELATLKAQEAVRKAEADTDKALAESKLPEAAKTKELRASLAKMDAESRKAVIEAAEAVAGEASGAIRNHQERGNITNEMTEADETKLAEAISRLY